MLKIKKSDVKYAVLTILMIFVMIYGFCDGMDSALDRYEARNNITSVEHR